MTEWGIGLLNCHEYALSQVNALDIARMENPLIVNNTLYRGVLGSAKKTPGFESWGECSVG